MRQKWKVDFSVIRRRNCEVAFSCRNRAGDLREDPSRWHAELPIGEPGRSCVGGAKGKDDYAKPWQWGYSVGLAEAVDWPNHKPIWFELLAPNRKNTKWILVITVSTYF